MTDGANVMTAEEVRERCIRIIQDSIWPSLPANDAIRKIKALDLTCDFSVTAREFHRASGIAIPLYATGRTDSEGHRHIVPQEPEDILAVVYRLMEAYAEYRLSQMRAALEKRNCGD